MALVKRTLPDPKNPSTHRARMHGRFALGLKRGSGTYGKVVRIDDDVLDTPESAGEARVVKFQVFDSDHADNKMFMREVATLLRVRGHPNIVHLVEYMHTLDYHGTMVLRECRGPSLAERLDAKCAPLSRPTAARWAYHLFEAVEYCHRQRVVHRDIKPDNLLLSVAGSDDDAQLVLADFGAACSFASDDDMRRGVVTAKEFTTIWYRPPEMVVADLACYGEQVTVAHGAPVDVWSAGCVLAELFDATDVLRYGALFKNLTHADLGRAMMRELGAPTHAIWPDGAEQFARFYGDYASYIGGPPLRWPHRRMVLEPDGIIDLVDAAVSWSPARRPTAREICAKMAVKLAAINVSI